MDHDKNDLNLFRQWSDKRLAGDRVSYAEYLAHISSQNAGARSLRQPTGRLPEFRLPDQHGQMRTFGDLVGSRGLLLSVVRSLEWCGYCRNQIADLVSNAPRLAAQGINPVLVSPDPIEVVRRIAREAEMKLPVLVDDHADFIEALGVLNRGIPEWAELQNGGRVPYPGQLLVDRHGEIVEARFTDDLRHRPSAASALFANAGEEAGDLIADFDAGLFAARLFLASRQARFGQEVAYRLSIAIADRWSLYGAPAPKGNRPLAVSFDGDAVQSFTAAFAEAPKPKVDKFSGERASTYEGRLSVTGVIRLRWSPPAHGIGTFAGIERELREQQVAPGTHALNCAIEFQGCSDEACMPPGRAELRGSIELLPDTPKVRAEFSREDIAAMAGLVRDGMDRSEVARRYAISVASLYEILRRS